MNRDKTLTSMQNMLKISREYTHNYEYKGSTSYEDSFQSIQALNLFQKLEELNTELSEILVKNKAFNSQEIDQILKNSENLDSKCMSTIVLLKKELESFLNNKAMTMEQLIKAENLNSIKMDFKYQPAASQYLTETKSELVQFEKDVQDLENLIHFINFRNPEDLYRHDIELETLFKKLGSSTETLIRFNEKFAEN